MGEHTLDIQVERGATCLDLELLADELAPWLKGVPIPPGVSVVVRGSIDDPRTIITRVRYPDGTLAERTFSPAPTFCPYLHQAVALSLSLQLKAAEGRAVATGGLDRPDDMEASVTPAEVSSRALELGVGPALAVGAVGAVGIGLALNLGVTWDYARIGVSPGFLYVPRRELAGGAGSYQNNVFLAQVGGCGRLPMSDRIRLEACITGALARVGISQHGSLRYTQTGRTLLGALPELAIHAQLKGNWVLRVGVAVMLMQRALRISARTEANAEVGSDDFSKPGGLFSVNIGYRIAIRGRSR